MRFSGKFILLLMLVSYSMLSAGCDSNNNTAEITIRNDIQDESYNKIVVDQIQHSRGVSLGKFTLRPGEEIEIPHKKISRFRVKRAYNDHNAIYEVTCPLDKSGVVIKLIDIYLNRMPAGCKLTKAGEERDGIIVWK